MDPDAALAIAPYLDAGESLLWAGRPRQGLLFRQSDILLIPFSIFWGGGVLVWMVVAISMDAPPFFTAFGIPFVVIALYLLLGRFFLNARERKNTFYGFTQSRIIILSGLFWRSIQSLSFRTLIHVSLEERPDRSGTIWLGPNNPWYSLTHAASITRYYVPSFELIDEARSVYDRMREAHARAT